MLPVGEELINIADFVGLRRRASVASSELTHVLCLLLHVPLGGHSIHVTC